MLGLDGYKSGSSDGKAAVAGNLFAKDLTTVGSESNTLTESTVNGVKHESL